MKIFTLPLIIAMLPMAAAPQAPPKTPQTHKPLPRFVIYGQLFKHVMFLENQADLAEKSGVDASELRNFYQVHAQLSAHETAALKQIARDTTSQVQAVDQNIQTVIKAFRAQFPGGRLSPGATPPPPPPELQTLQDQKDNVQASQVVALQKAFGESRFQSFDNYVQAEFAPHVTVSQVAPAHPKPAVARAQLPQMTPAP